MLKQEEEAVGNTQKVVTQFQGHTKNDMYIAIIYLSIYLFIYLSIYLSIYLYNIYIYVSQRTLLGGVM